MERNVTPIQPLGNGGPQEVALPTALDDEESRVPTATIEGEHRALPPEGREPSATEAIHHEPEGDELYRMLPVHGESRIVQSSDSGVRAPGGAYMRMHLLPFLSMELPFLLLSSFW